MNTAAARGNDRRGSALAALDAARVELYPAWRLRSTAGSKNSTAIDPAIFYRPLSIIGATQWTGATGVGFARQE
jgi:hypothetical protein